MPDTGAVTGATQLPSQLPTYLNRIPRSMAEFRGPEHGMVGLPVRVAWSGLREYDIDNPAERLTLYRSLMDCGQREDIGRYINGDLLREEWPRIRRLTARRIIDLWERLLPALASAV
jgi:hypothetical protein